MKKPGNVDFSTLSSSSWPHWGQTLLKNYLSEDNITDDKALGKYRIQLYDNVEGLFDKNEATEYEKN